MTPLFDYIFDDFFPKYYFTTKERMYPQFNVVKKSETELVLEVALAGFKRDEINVTCEPGKFTITAEKTKAENKDYMLKNIGERSVKESWKLGNNMKLDENGVKYEDGILSIPIVKHIPEHEKPRSLKIW